MKRFFRLFFLVSLISCGRGTEPPGRIITVSIPPFKYFVEGIAGKNFTVNVMVPAGANPHIYEPFPDQINQLRKSVAYISDGFLGFEMTWLDRFYEMNRTMKRLSLGDKIEPIVSGHRHDGGEVEGADPHFWVSPVCAFKIAEAVEDLLSELDPGNRTAYEKNFNVLKEKITDADAKAKELSSIGHGKSFMIYHPNLAYLARDYGFEEIAVEFEGKEPTPSRLIELTDRARKENLKIILVQREYDTKNARSIADETGAKVVIIDPLSEDWYKSTVDIINILKESFTNNLN
ncbi:MAG: zinc ABC transporter substrate-binding protein [Bacteroidota bacterium]|nr:zinc ABC transporter substrate-binding protein [Bacteroidota bacterium]